MANNYKNAAVVLTSTGATDLYTCPSGRTAIVQSVNVANVDSSNRDVTVTLYDSSVATSYTVIYNATIPVGVSMNALSTPLVLEPGDIVRVQASAANTLHATASVLEQDATAIQVDGSITTAKIADDAVTADKLAIPGSVIQMAYGSTSTQVTNATGTRIATGLQATITPRFSTSQIVVQASIEMRSLSSSSADGGAGFDIRRNGTVVYSDGQNYRAYSNPSDYFAQTVALNYLDSPSSTAALTYSVFFASYNGTVDVQDDNLYASTMLLWEIAA